MLHIPVSLSQLRKKKGEIAAITAMVAHLSLPFFSLQQANAASLTEASIRLNRLAAATAASSTDPILVIVKPATTIGSGASPKVQITWPTSSAFTVSSTDADHTADTTCVPATYQGEAVDTLTVTSPGAETSGVVTFDVGEALTAATLYGFCITGGITNPSNANAGTHCITIDTYTGATPVDTKVVAVDTLGTNGDQVAVTASINSTFDFTIADTTIALGTLTTGAVSANAMSPGIDLDTNAANGWIAWIKSDGTNDTLRSANTSDEISSTDTGNLVTCSAGSECYLVDVAVSQNTGGGSNGTMTIATEYDGNGTTTGGVIDHTNYEQIAQSTGQANSDTITLTGLAAISAVNEAATDYSDNWHVIGAGNF